MKQIKISELIARAEEKKGKAKETRQLFIKSLGGEITIEKPDRALCLDAMDMGHDGDNYMVYGCVVEPSLKDSTLQQAYGCSQPLDIVEAIFEPGEIAQIAQKAVELAGYSEDAVTVVNDIKKQ